jgi:hypothetical protein
MTNAAMSATNETPVMQRQILLVGPYGVTRLATYAAMSRELGLPLRFPGTKRQSAQRNLQCIERRRLSLEATVE